MADTSHIDPGFFESRQDYQDLIENLHAGLIVHAPDTRILLSNSRAGELLGLSVDQMLGKTSLDPAWCFTDRDGQPMPIADYPVDRVLATGLPLRNLVAGIRRPASGDRVWVLCNAYPVTAADGALRQVVVTFIDITEQRRAEADAQRLEGQFRQAQRIEAVGQLAGGIAHDFNNLLTAIQGYCNLLNDELGHEARASEPLAQISRAAERAAELTRQLLAFSSKQLLQPRLIDLNDRVADVETLLRRVIGEHIELVTRMAPGLAVVLADPGQVEQVLMNLALNARDAMPDGGSLTITTANVVLDEQQGQAHGDALAGPHVMVSVADTGRGMDPATQARIFEPFFTTKEAGRGTGLGLSMVYGIVRQSGGGIRVRSTPGQGTVFEIYLPAADGAAAPVGRSPVEAGGSRGTGKVLVVEDDEAVLYITARILRGHGYEVLEAGGAAEALRVSRDCGHPLDLLLTDIVMPQTDGRTLARQLTERQPGLRVLYMSGYASTDIVHRGIFDDATAFIQKPFTSGQLLDKVREVLDGDPGLARA